MGCNPNDYSYRELLYMADGRNLAIHNQFAYLAAVIVNIHSTQKVTIDEMKVYNSIYNNESQSSKVEVTPQNSAVAVLAANADDLGLKVVNARIEDAK